MIDTFEIKLFNIPENLILKVFESIPRLRSMYELFGHCSCVERKLHITINQNFTLKVSGSLSEFYYGRNIHTLNYDDLQNAITKLEHMVGISLDEAKIIRLHITSNVFTKYSPNVYFKYLLAMPYKDRFEKTSSLYFYSNEETVVLYDKNVKSKIADKRYCLRFENKLKSNKFIKNKLQIERVKSLKNENTYNVFVNYWIKNYSLIIKEAYHVRSENLKKVSELKYLLQSEGIRMLGVDPLLKHIKELLKCEEIDTMTAHRMKNFVLNTFNSNRVKLVQEENVFIQELNRLFEEEHTRLLHVRNNLISDTEMK